jgi:hypothetical protein
MLMMRAQHDGQGAIPNGVIVGAIIQWAKAGDASIVNKNINPAKAGCNLSHHFLNGLMVCHIQRKGTGRGEACRRYFRHHSLARSKVKVSYGHLRAFARKQMGRGAPHARGCAGDDHMAASDRPAQWLIRVHILSSYAPD